MSKKDPFQPGLLTRLARPPERIAVLRASRIGDFLCSVPALRALRTALPRAEITMITLPILGEIAQHCRYIDRVAFFPGFPWIAEQFFEAGKTVRFLAQMQKRQFDLAIQMQGTGVYSNPFTLLLGARMAVGFVRPGDPAGLLDAALAYPQQEHEIETVLSLMTFLGIPPQGYDLEFPLWMQDQQDAQELIRESNQPLIGLHPAARDATRCWSVERFARVGNILQRRHGGTVLLLGEKEEQHTGEQLTCLLEVPYLNLIGKTSLVSLGALLTRLSVFITNDTGPAHIAYALKVPTVTVFGGGNPATNGPLMQGPFRILKYDVACRPCFHQSCPIQNACLQGVTVDQAADAAEAIFLTNNFL